MPGYGLRVVSPDPWAQVKKADIPYDAKGFDKVSPAGKKMLQCARRDGVVLLVSLRAFHLLLVCM